MKIVVSTSLLSQRIQNIRGVIASKSTLAILDCFLFETNGLNLTITAADADNRLVTSIELIECDTDARFCINAKTLIDLLKELSDQPVAMDIDLETMRISVRYQNGEFNIVGSRADDYPDMQFVADNADTITMSCSQLSEGITRCMSSVADDEMRPVMCGIMMDVTTENTTFVSTDGHKLVRNIVPVVGEKAFSAIITKKLSMLLRTFLVKEEGDAIISTNGRAVCVKTASYTLSGKLIEGRYPNYNSVIPMNNPFVIQIDRQALLSAARRVVLFSSQSNSLVKLQITTGTLTLSGQDYDFSTSAEEYVICQYADQPITIGFKGQLLIELLGLLDCEEICLKLSDPSRPGLIVPANENEDGSHVLVLLMPMMVKD